MKKLNYIIALVILLSSIGCSMNDGVEYNYANDPNAVIVNVEIAQTKANTEADGNAFTAGDTFGVINTVSKDGDNAPVTYVYRDGVWNLEDGRYMLWEKGKNSFKAWLPASSSFDDFEIPADQSTLEGLRSADWLKASVENMERPENRQIDLKFQHQLARVVVEVVKYHQPYDGSEAIVDPYFRMPSSSVPDGITCASEVVKGYIQDKVMNVLLAPGQYVEGEEFMTFTVGGCEFDVTVPIGGLKFEAGKAYKFKLEVYKHEAPVVIAVEVLPWNAVSIGTEEVLLPWFEQELYLEEEAPYKDLCFVWKGDDIDSLWYALRPYQDTAAIPTTKELFVVDSETLANLNYYGEFSAWFLNLKSSTEYELIAYAKNKKGELMMCSNRIVTEALPEYISCWYGEWTATSTHTVRLGEEWLDMYYEKERVFDIEIIAHENSDYYIIYGLYTNDKSIPALAGANKYLKTMDINTGDGNSVKYNESKGTYLQWTSLFCNHEPSYNIQTEFLFGPGEDSDPAYRMYMDGNTAYSERIFSYDMQPIAICLMWRFADSGYYNDFYRPNEDAVGAERREYYPAGDYMMVRKTSVSTSGNSVNTVNTGFKKFTTERVAPTL